LKTNRRSFLAMLGLAPIAAKSIDLEKTPLLDVSRAAIRSKPNPVRWTLKTKLTEIRDKFGSVEGMIIHDDFYIERAREFSPGIMRTPPFSDWVQAEEFIEKVSPPAFICVRLNRGGMINPRGGFLFWDEGIPWWIETWEAFPKLTVEL
jgi:hypothetical protein